MSVIHGLRSSRVANVVRRFLHGPQPTFNTGLLEQLSFYKTPKPRKLLHIGANSGQEVKGYQANGIEAWHVEAIPAIYKALCEACAPYPDQHPLNACLSSQEGLSQAFHIATNSGQSSSLLGLGRHEVAYPSIKYDHSIDVITSTVDGLIAKGDIPEDIDTLVIDAQGAELMILQGCKMLLSSAAIQAAIIETAVEPLYEGRASYLDVSSLLRHQGLYLCRANFNRAGWCDAIYSRQYWP